MFRFLFRRSEDQNTACPYCGATQEPPPQRKRKCRDCGEPIYVQKLRDGTKRLLTEDEARKRERSERDKRRDDLKTQAQSALAERDWQTASQAYFGLASIQFEEGKEHYQEAQEAHKCDLLSKREAGIKKVEILTCDDERVCDECRTLEGKVFAVGTALKRMPLPGQHCKDGSDKNPHGGRCRCVYVAVL